MFKKLLIANRGEIARRICQVAHRMGISTVAVYSDADAQLPFVREADEAVRIGAAAPRESYLNATAVIEAARKTGAEAIHPGYGFLSESADFALACASAAIAFVGPSPQSMARMKDKSEARRIVQAAGVPIIPGSPKLLADAREAAEIAEQIGFPVLCKAAAGGGGIGMAVAANPTELEKVFRQCSDRALSAFGRGAVYLERFFASPRHIEVQILGDSRGHLIHCLERECSIQRRHQKVVEEAPSPLFATGAAAEHRSALFEAALTAAKAFGYSNAGTVEFLYAQGAFYFIEINARLQVEHPITELTTGLDLIGWQLRIAAGEALTVKQGEVQRNGAAIEFRIYAEDPSTFFPSPGVIKVLREPIGTGIRLDCGYQEGNEITPYYDPMIAKLVVRGATREEVIARSTEALDSFQIEGVKTNLPLHRRIVRNADFRGGNIHTGFLANLPKA